MLNFSTKTAIVTGGSRGIGKEISLILDASEPLKEVSGLFTVWSIHEPSKKNIHPFCCDISDEKSIEELYEFVISKFGHADVLVNNAGIHMDNILLRMKSEEWNQVMNVNLNGPFHLTKTVLKDMVKNKNGRIINISSISGTDGNKGQGNYAASKGGLLALTKSLAKEVGRRNITVNCIAPGLIETDMTSHLSDTVKQGYLDRIPLKKLGKPKDIGQMILFLCSDEASYITGQTFYIDGGMSLN